MGEGSIREGVSDDSVLGPVNAGNGKVGGRPSRIPGCRNGGPSGWGGSHDGRCESREKERSEHVVSDKECERKTRKTRTGERGKGWVLVYIRLAGIVTGGSPSLRRGRVLGHAT